MGVRRQNLARLARLTRKELRETLRDRRTVITLVLMPLLVYPLLSISFQKSLLVNVQQTTDEVYSVGVESQAILGEYLQPLLARGDRILKAREQAESERSSAGSGATSPAPAARVSFRWFPGSPLEQHVRNLDVQVGVRLRPLPTVVGAPRGLQPVYCELIHRGNSPTSQRALRFLEERLRAVNDASVRERLANSGMYPGLPAEIAYQPVAADTTTPFSLATLVPLVLILMTITGAVYPAIDLTAGERERGTLETLIAAPISRMALLAAKYAAVLTVAVLTAVVNLVAMSVTILSSRLGAELFPGGLSLVLIAEVFALTVLFAAFFSAILLALTSFARSFKEAQAYLIPVMLLAIAPGLLSLMPGLRLNGLLAVTPLLNIVLLSRDLLEGTAAPAMMVLAVVSTIVYAAAAIALASRVFGNDALLYASRGSWSDLFRRPELPREAPTPAATLFCLAVMFPCFFLLANVAGLRVGSVHSQLILNAAITAAVFGLCPLLFSAAQRVRLLAGFQLRPAPWWAFVGAASLGTSLWPMAHEIFLFGRWLGLASLDASQFAAVERMLDAFRVIPPAVVLLTLAVVPAVLEEFFFRGYLFNGLRDRFRGGSIVVVSAFLFGLFHVLTPSLLTPERFLPSCFMGLVLGWVCYRTRSVLPSMLLHAIHNGLLLGMALNRDRLAARGWNLPDAEHLPRMWLAVAVVVTAAAGALVWYATRATNAASERIRQPHRAD